MNRLQKKCLIGAVGMHLLLLLILLVGPAFLSSKVEPEPVIIELVNMKVTDGKTQGGGNPAVTLPPPPKAVEQPSPPKPEPIKEEVKLPPPKPEPKPEPKPKHEAEVPVAEPKKIVQPKPDPKPAPKPEVKTATKPKLELKPVVRNPSAQPTAAKNTAAEQQQKALQELAKNLSSARANIQSKMSSSTSVEMPGVGGEAFVPYAQLVKAMYDRAWLDPQDVADDNANVKVEVIIERRGNVVSAKILSRSGNPAMDKSVQRALDRVQFIAPFPDGSRDQRRVFILNFNLKAKRLTG